MGAESASPSSMSTCVHTCPRCWLQLAGCHGKMTTDFASSTSRWQRLHGTCSASACRALTTSLGGTSAAALSSAAEAPGPLRRQHVLSITPGHSLTPREHLQLKGRGACRETSDKQCSPLRAKHPVRTRRELLSLHLSEGPPGRQNAPLNVFSLSDGLREGSLGQNRSKKGSLVASLRRRSAASVWGHGAAGAAAAEAA